MNNHERTGLYGLESLLGRSLDDFKKAGFRKATASLAAVTAMAAISTGAALAHPGGRGSGGCWNVPTGDNYCILLSNSYEVNGNANANGYSYLLYCSHGTSASASCGIARLSVEVATLR